MGLEEAAIQQQEEHPKGYDVEVEEILEEVYGEDYNELSSSSEHNQEEEDDQEQTQQEEVQVDEEEETEDELRINQMAIARANSALERARSGRASNLWI